MITVETRIRSNKMTPALKNISAALESLPKQIAKKLIELTPEDSGNARRKTRLAGRYKIVANYAYAGVLDRGRHKSTRGMRGSKQAPKGMTRPTKDWTRQRIRKILKARR